MSVLSKEIHELVQQAETLWKRYLELGPGKLRKEEFDPLDVAIQRVNQNLSTQAQSIDCMDELRGAIDDLADLLRRCVERTEGLSFVTGEAGLIPRKDLHQRCDAAICTLRDFATE